MNEEITNYVLVAFQDYNLIVYYPTGENVVRLMDQCAELDESILDSSEVVRWSPNTFSALSETLFVQ